jgi:radical SAM protein with 4Fe4S-binding SPASM domain
MSDTGLKGILNLINRLRPRRSGSAGVSPPPGLYHYQRQSLGERSRVHLRLDRDGNGLLLVNASRVVHLNPTAALMAYLFLEGVPEDQAQRTLTRRYAVPPQQARLDFQQVAMQIGELVRPNGACPVHDLQVETIRPFSARPSAPYRMDLALTYRCNNDCAHCYNARPRDYAELPTDEWKRILDRLWRLGIPHVVFTGGEPTLRDDLPALIAHAEGNGQITGLNTNGRRLSDRRYLASLVEAGLDHVQITLESHDPAIHDHMVRLHGAWRQTVAGLRNALDTPLFVMTNTTMLRDNSPVMDKTLDFLAETGVPTVGLNALIYSGKGATVGTGLQEGELVPLLEIARQKTEQSGQRLIWYTPTQYCHFDPMLLDLGVKGCTAALYNMCVEPDGAVIPCQSYYQPLGYLLRDRWDSIWNHELSVSLRERRNLPEKCKGCVLLQECGGGCPLQF